MRLRKGIKTVKDLSATVKFKVKDSENEYFLGWTTTPWTLPANVALAVHPNMEYVKSKTRKSCIHCCERTCTRSIKKRTMKYYLFIKAKNY